MIICIKFSLFEIPRIVSVFLTEQCLLSCLLTQIDCHPLSLQYNFLIDGHLIAMSVPYILVFVTAAHHFRYHNTDTKATQRTTIKEIYRQVSCINIMQQSLIKISILSILASRIQQHIKRIIHHEQMGFISGMQGWSNIQKLISVISHINKMKGKDRMIISTE